MFNLIKKWLDGSINWQEEKQLRNQSKIDPFLADAMEGYDAMPEVDHSKKIAALQNSLRQSAIATTNTPHKIKRLPIRAIAASLALLLAIGAWWTLQQQLEAPPNLAESTLEMPSETNSKSIVSTPMSDAIAMNEFEEGAIKEETPSIIPKEKEVAIVSTTKQTQQKASTPPPPTILNSTKPAVNKEASEVIAATESTPVVRTPALPILPDTAPASVTVAEGIEEDIAIVNSAPAIERIEGDVANAASATVQEAYTEDAGMQVFQEAEVTNTKVRSRRGSLNILDNLPSTATPVGGIDAFEKYIQEHQKIPAPAKSAGLKGLVILSFTINPDSSIQQVQVLKGLSPDCDREAIRLLKSGPKWVSSIGEGTCVVRF